MAEDEEVMYTSNPIVPVEDRREAISTTQDAFAKSMRALGSDEVIDPSDVMRDIGKHIAGNMQMQTPWGLQPVAVTSEEHLRVGSAIVHAILEGGYRILLPGGKVLQKKE